jgi:hypothetical protein
MQPDIWLGGVFGSAGSFLHVLSKVLSEVLDSIVKLHFSGSGRLGCRTARAWIRVPHGDDFYVRRSHTLHGTF